ncbi:MAG: patatin-like phospholipase family protein [Gammaproteobacteria bacterium]|nr:patatin-like phospholipase family protein [Gammaproteobacteria bacterium]
MNRLLATLLATLLLISGYTSASSAADVQRRFSMAISGGASKGAYEAGLNWGLLEIMRDIDKIDPSVIGQANRMEAASFTGASAGGINTLLSGLSWCSLPRAQGGLANTIDDNVFRDVWLNLDVNRLLPPSADSIYYDEDDALLSRHDLLQAAGKIRGQWNTPSFRPGCRIPLGVTVTRVVPEAFKVGNIQVQNQRMYIPFEARTRADGTLGFYFEPDDYPRLSDPAMILLPRAKNAPVHSIEDQRIEDAALTSSAFPGAFGRKRLQYCRLSAYAAIDEKDTREAVQAAANLVCPEGYELVQAEFADGGLFDNLPIGLARILAEEHELASDTVRPVTYVYLDPDRLRYDVPSPADMRACAGDDPPAACETLDFSLLSEQALLLGALGTARKYELYRELTSDYWTLNLAQLSYELADSLETSDSRLDCSKEIAFNRTELDCAEAVRRAGALLELAYNRASLPITTPYSAKRLYRAGIVHDCQYQKSDSVIASEAECKINVNRYRKRLGNILLNIAGKYQQVPEDFVERIDKAMLSMHNDRILQVTSRGVPITGTLLSDFGAFLDLKFREYDYYAGVYDAVIIAAQTMCSQKFSEQRQPKEFKQCQDALAENLHDIIDVDTDPRGRYVFARLAQWEFGEQQSLRFAYTPLPEEDRDMRIIFDGLIETLEAGEKSDVAKKELFFTENTFFLHLNDESFDTTPTEDGSTPLLKQIIADPTKWPSELTRRMTTRMVYLEQEARDIYAAREPNPDLRENSHTSIMGIAAYSWQTVTYNYPDYTFAPSTAPENWIWRNLIPHEFAFDVVDRDLLFTWQPTWALSHQDLLAVRASLGVAEGIINQAPEEIARKNYGALGLSYIRRNNSTTLSSWGITPTWYHKWDDPGVVSQDTLGGDVHVSFFNDKLRVGLGARDFNYISDTWFVTVGLTDIPGLTYWLTR